MERKASPTLHFLFCERSPEGERCVIEPAGFDGEGPTDLVRAPAWNSEETT